MHPDPETKPCRAHPHPRAERGATMTGSVAQQTGPARAEKTLEEKLQAIGELVDGLPSLAPRLQSPGELAS